MTRIQKFAILVRKARTEKGLTQQQLVDKANSFLRKGVKPILRQGLAKLEYGDLKAKHWPVDMVNALCKALDIQESDIDNVVENPVPTQFESLKNHDVLPIIKRIATIPGLENLTFEQLCLLCESDQRCKNIGISLADLLAK